MQRAAAVQGVGAVQRDPAVQRGPAVQRAPAVQRRPAVQRAGCSKRKTKHPKEMTRKTVSFSPNMTEIVNKPNNTGDTGNND